MKCQGRLIGLLLTMGLANLVHAGKVTYVYTDAQGTPIMESDAQGNITARYDYRPYGMPVATMNTPPDGPGYTGHMNDADTALVYMQARYYDPEIGKFISVDPVGLTGVDNFNRYAYAQNNPVTMVDPDGRAAKLAELIRLVGSGMRSIARVSREEAVVAKKAGRDVRAATRQEAHQIANAASEGRGVVKDVGHELKDGSKGLPHYHTLDAKGNRESGHVFWGKMSVLVVAAADAVDKVADAADYIPDPVPMPAEQEDIDRSNNIIDSINKLLGSNIPRYPPMSDHPVLPPFPEPEKQGKNPSGSHSQ